MLNTFKPDATISLFAMGSMPTPFSIPPAVWTPLLTLLLVAMSICFRYLDNNELEVVPPDAFAGLASLTTL